jgi:hypothetical protein
VGAAAAPSPVICAGTRHFQQGRVVAAQQGTVPHCYFWRPVLRAPQGPAILLRRGCAPCDWPVVMKSDLCLIA